MPTFGDWEREVLTHTYDDVDYISCHAYYQEKDGDLGSFLASAVDMQHVIDTVVATADRVGRDRGSEKKIAISFDEWNVWYSDQHQDAGPGDEWRHAPRLLENVYSVADAVVVGSLLITLLKNHDRVRSASLAQLVNVIAPIMTEPGGPAWRQTIFFPFSVMSRLARGEVLRAAVRTGGYDTNAYGEADGVDAVATYDPTSGEAALFLVNRNQTSAEAVTVDLHDLGVADVRESVSLFDDDVYARNTLEAPDRVRLRTNATATLRAGVLTVELPPVSWTAISLA